MQFLLDNMKVSDHISSSPQKHIFFQLNNFGCQVSLIHKDSKLGRKICYYMMKATFITIYFLTILICLFHSRSHLWKDPNKQVHTPSSSEAWVITKQDENK